MAQEKEITELTALSTVADGDKLPIVDVSDTSATSDGTTKHITKSNLFSGTLTDSSTDTLTNKTIDLTDNTLTGTLAEFNTALSDDNFATLGAANAFTGANTFTIADTANAVGLTINQNDVTNDPATLKLLTAVNAYGNGDLILEKTGGEFAPPYMVFRNSATVAPGGTPDIAYIGFNAEDGSGNDTEYANIYAYSTDNTDTTETGVLEFSVRQAGTLKKLLTLFNVNGLTVGATGAAGVVESNGNQDLILQTGNATTGTITITNGANGAINLAPNGTGVVQAGGVEVATISGTQTLTNKDVSGATNTLIKKSTEASSATPTPTGDSDINHYSLTALATAPTFAAPSGTPAEGNRLTIRIHDNGTARALAWNAIYTSTSEATLPTTTVLGKEMFLGFLYDSTDSKWRLVAIANES